MSMMNQKHTRVGLLLAGLVAVGAVVSGCATVKPYEMEHLADELMTNPQEFTAAAHEMKWLEAREGSTGGIGGIGGAGGGCACK